MSVVTIRLICLAKKEQKTTEVKVDSKGKSGYDRIRSSDIPMVVVTKTLDVLVRDGPPRDIIIDWGTDILLLKGHLIKEGDVPIVKIFDPSKSPAEGWLIRAPKKGQKQETPLKPQRFFGPSAAAVSPHCELSWEILEVARERP